MSAPATWADDAFFAGHSICERLRAELPELRAVLMIDELDGPEPKQTPAAVVLLHALRPAGDPQRTNVKTDTDWLIVLAVKPVRGAGARAGEKLGPLIPRAVRALQGWKPEGSNQALAWRPGAKPDYGKNITYFPLLFTHQVMTA